MKRQERSRKGQERSHEATARKRARMSDRNAHMGFVPCESALRLGPCRRRVSAESVRVRVGGEGNKNAHRAHRGWGFERRQNGEVPRTSFLHKNSHI